MFHCRSLRGHTFCVNRKYAKSHKRGGDCVFPAPFETPPLNRQRETIAMVSLEFLPRRAKLQLSSVVFNALLIFTGKAVGNVKHCTILRGYPKGAEAPFGCCG